MLNRALLIIRDFECDPMDISRLLKVEATKSWRVGDRRGSTRLEWSDNGWMLEPPYVNPDRFDLSAEIARIFVHLNHSEGLGRVIPASRRILYVVLRDWAIIKNSSISTEVLRQVVHHDVSIEFDVDCE